MEIEVHLVHAPSASGKTTFLNTGTSSEYCVARKTGELKFPDLIHRFGDCGVVDGDELIHHTIGWPGDKTWFKQAGATLVHFAQLAAILNNAVRIQAPSWMNHLVIMFNGGMKKIAVATKLYMVDREDGSPVKLHHHAMIPSREDHERNIESRRKENQKTGDWMFPENWGDAHNNRESTRKIAELFDLEVRDNFEEIMADISAEAMNSSQKEGETQESGGNESHITELEFEELKEYLKDNASWTKDLTTYDPILKKDKTRTIGAGCWDMQGMHYAVSFNFSGQQVHVCASQPGEKDITINAFERWADYRGGVQLGLTKLVHLIDNMSSGEIHTFIMSDEHAPKITEAGSQPEGDRDRLRTWEQIVKEAGQ